MTSLTVARGYAQRGWAPLPIASRSKAPAIDGWQNLRITESELPNWFNGKPQNVGVLLGEPSDWLIDVDLDHRLAVELADLYLPPTAAEFGRVGKPRSHRLYNVSAPVTTKKHQLRNRETGESEMIVELRSTGCQTIFPGSIHDVSGEAIEWVTDGVPAVIAPEVLVAAVKKLADTVLTELGEPEKGCVKVDNLNPVDTDSPDRDRVLSALAALNPGRADSYFDWTAVGMALHSFDLGLADEFDRWSQQSAKYREGEPARKWQSFNGGGITVGTLFKMAIEDGWRPPKSINGVAGNLTKSVKLITIDPLSVIVAEGQTDLANSRRFVKLCGDRARFSHAWGKWYVWDGARWKLDDDGAVMRLAKSVADSVWAEARRCDDAGALKFASRTAQDRSIKSLLSLAASDLSIRLDEVDRDPFLLNCPNGTLNLRTGELSEHRREDFLTKVTGAAFNPEAGSYVWDRTLEAVFDGHSDVIEFVQRFFGYSLTADVREHVLPVPYGVGANGKSTVIEAFMNAFGTDYSSKAAPDLLLTKRGESHPTERADLFGKRFVACVETENDRRLNESLVKELTGGDTVKARRMREDFWQFTPTWKLVLCTNHKPGIRGTDHGIWRRIRLVPFTQIFDGERQDRALSEKLRAEAEGILAWAVRGCLAWQRDGLGEPAAVKEATAGYRIEQNIVGQFIAERCQLGRELFVKAKDLRLAFEDWATDAGQAMVQARRFGQELTTRGIERYTNNGTCYRGIGLKT